MKALPMLATVLAGLAMGGAMAAGDNRAPVHYRATQWATADDAGFTLLALVTVDGRTESFAVDHDLTREDCGELARKHPGDYFNDIGVRIAVETASTFDGFRLACVAERAA